MHRIGMAVTALLAGLGLMAGTALADGPASRFAEDVTGRTFVCEDASYEIVSDELRVVTHEASSPSGNATFTVKFSMNDVVAADELARLRSTAGAAQWFALAPHQQRRHGQSEQLVGPHARAATEPGTREQACFRQAHAQRRRSSHEGGFNLGRVGRGAQREPSCLQVFAELHDGERPIWKPLRVCGDDVLVQQSHPDVDVMPPLPVVG